MDFTPHISSKHLAENNSPTKNTYKLMVYLVIFALTFPLRGFAEDSFDSLGGYKIGQPCNSESFSLKKSNVRNPKDVLDKISVERAQLNKTLEHGHKLSVRCSIITNQVHAISITSENLKYILELQKILEEEMGRSPDDEQSYHSKPQILLGTKLDGMKSEFKTWQLGNKTKASAWSNANQPFGANSIEDFKWNGGISLEEADYGVREWDYLKSSGKASSKDKERENDQKRVEDLRKLLE